LRVGHTQDDDYLRNRGEDYGVMYDNRGRISKVLYPGENNQPVMEVEYQYNDPGQITKIIARDLTKGAVTDIYCMEYEYDSNARKVRQVIKEQESDLDTDAYYVTTFNYDSRDMLIEEKYLRWDNTNSVWKVMYWGRYLYDIAGNMYKREVEQIVNGNGKSYMDIFTYSRGYQLTTFDRWAPLGGQGQGRTFTLTYDSNGNMTHIQQNQAFTDSFYDITEMEFDYDAKNRLVKYRFGGAGSWYEIKYDALGRVRERVDLTPTTTKYYSDGRQLVQQLDNSNTVQFDYLRGPTGLDRQWNETNDTRRFYIKDNLGTVWAIVNPSDLSVKPYNYNAWGEHLDKDDTDFPTDANWMRYIGCRVEAFGKGTTTQRDVIYHLDHRHYCPDVMGFISRDPLNIDPLWSTLECPLDQESSPSPRLPLYQPRAQAFGGCDFMTYIGLNRNSRCENRRHPGVLPSNLATYLYSSCNPSNVDDPSGLYNRGTHNCCRHDPGGEKTAKDRFFAVVVFDEINLCGFTCSIITWNLIEDIPCDYQAGTPYGIGSFGFFPNPPYTGKWFGKNVYWLDASKLQGTGEKYTKNPLWSCLSYMEISCQLLPLTSQWVPAPNLLPGFTWLDYDECWTKLESQNPNIQYGTMKYVYNNIPRAHPYSCAQGGPC